MSALDNNLECIKNKYKDLYKEITSPQKNNNDTFEVVECKDGNSTVRLETDDGCHIFLHSKFNPAREAEVFARENYDESIKIYLLYGFGLGFHVVELFKLLGSDCLLFVFDIDIAVFSKAIELYDFSQMLNDERVILNVSMDIMPILEGLRDATALEEDKKMLLHLPSVQSIPKKFSEFKFILEDWNIRKGVDFKYKELLKENAVRNLALLDRNIGELFGKFKNIPVIIVSAGPSLENNIRDIKLAKNKALIISAGKSLKPLIINGIRPDFFIMIDPQEIIFEEIHGIENLDIPAIFLITAASKCVREYKGPKYAAIQDSSFKPSEQQWLVKSGGSVATTSMDIALKMGANPIVFVGQDLAYTNNKMHPSGTMYKDNVYIEPLKNMRKVTSINGEVLTTSLGLLSFKRWIENRISDEPDVLFINASEGGAGIKGAVHMTLKEAVNKYMKEEYDFIKMISENKRFI